MVNALDAMWLAYTLIALISAVAMPALIWSANVLWAHTYVRVAPGPTGKMANGGKMAQQQGVTNVYYN
jgi:hypothetical protein